MSEPIPPYDSEVALAIQALEGYCQKRGRWFDIHYFQGSNEYRVVIGIPQHLEDLHRKVGICHKSLARAICEAIVAHHESK